MFIYLSHGPNSNDLRSILIIHQLHFLEIKKTPSNCNDEKGSETSDMQGKKKNYSNLTMLYYNRQQTVIIGS